MPTDHLPNLRLATDEEYEAKRRCGSCDAYSQKTFDGTDRSRGKCFGDKSPACLVGFVDDHQICDLFIPKRNTSED